MALGPSSEFSTEFNRLWQQQSESSAEDSTLSPVRSDDDEDQFWDQFIEPGYSAAPRPRIVTTPPMYSPLEAHIDQQAPELQPDYFSLAVPTARSRSVSPFLRPPSPRPAATPVVHRSHTRLLASLPEGPQTPPVERPQTPRSQLSRQRTRERARAQLLSVPLNASEPGRQVLKLRDYTWYRMPNGMAVMRFDTTDPIEHPHEMAAYINYLNCGAWAHRSVVCRCLAVMHIECLNYAFAHAQEPPIVPVVGVPSWVGSMRVRPVFLRDSFISSAVRLVPGQTEQRPAYA